MNIKIFTERKLRWSNENRKMNDIIEIYAELPDGSITIDCNSAFEVLYRIEKFKSYHPNDDIEWVIVN